ncbi:c-type cytochrome [Marinobacterium arenosum]|uniref:c-type cytochrome n=1 Tax=Marinobacterium arenosum TaxID=2862496 RepID=UPI001C971912|nr:cytochrome c family protein [Marinobacterium arenosum]MBY4677628.1 cytochrome c family protein [Marinobacterium arenosum]
MANQSMIDRVVAWPVPRPLLLLRGLLLWAVIATSATAATEQAEQSPSTGATLNAPGALLALVCNACHSLQAGAPHKLGPNLWNLIGRPVASAAGFDYSPAMKALGGHWSAERLDGYLKDPAGFAPGNRMAFAGLPDQSQRKALIAYLATLSDQPPAVKQGQEADGTTPFDYGGLPPGEGRELVYGRCSACHSLMLVKQQGLSRERWQYTLEWMVEEQGMEPLAEEQLKQLLDYLSEHYGETSR